MALLNQMLVDRKRMEDELTSGSDDKDKVIELRWMDENEVADEDKPKYGSKSWCYDLRSYR